MSGWEFTIRLIEALAWPAAIVVIVFSFRGELRKMLPLLRKLKAGPIEAEFEKAILEAKEEAELLTYDSNAIEVLDNKAEPLLKLAESNPRSAILESWLGVESALKRAAFQHAGSPLPSASSPIQQIRVLDRDDLLNPVDVALFHDLRGLRNQAVHISDLQLSSTAAKNYIELAANLQSRLEKLSEPSQ